MGACANVKAPPLPSPHREGSHEEGCNAFAPVGRSSSGAILPRAMPWADSSLALQAVLSLPPLTPLPSVARSALPLSFPTPFFLHFITKAPPFGMSSAESGPLVRLRSECGERTFERGVAAFEPLELPEGHLNCSYAALSGFMCRCRAGLFTRATGALHCSSARGRIFSPHFRWFAVPPALLRCHRHRRAAA